MDAIDYFAGAGGWDVACHWLGIDVEGVENMPAALETREANGLATLLNDVWQAVLAEQPYTHTLQIASPPCQPFSTAGKGAGRRALDDVYRLIQQGAHRDGQTYVVTSAHLDPKTSLVLTPLVLAWRDRPEYIAWEQVPAVLPVWEACADVLRSIGYSVWTGNVQAEQYGVPQTRRRAVLIARRDGLEAHRPIPTHSKYHSRDPKRLDPGVLPWVSMAQALGWGTERVEWEAHVRRSQRRVDEHGARPGRPADAPAFTITGHDGHPRGGFEFHLPDGSRQALDVATAAALQTFPRYVSGGGSSSQVAPPRPLEHPAPTITGSGTAEAHDRAGVAPGPDMRAPGARRLEPAEAAALQTFPVAYRNGNQAHAATRPTDAPAPTIHFGARANAVDWLDDDGVPARRVTVAEAGALQTFPTSELDREALAGMVRSRINDQSGTAYDPEWPADRPALTIAGRGLVPNPGATANRYNGSTKSRNDGVLIEPDEAAALQTFPGGFVFTGTKSDQYLQAGNAVPPVLAAAILGTFL